MSAFIIFQAAVNDPAGFAEYAKSVPPTLIEYGGTIMTKGKTGSVLAGENQYTHSAILQFTDLEKTHAWHHSDAYQALIPPRDAAAEMAVTSHQVPAG
jgi:uncharacterized protein (DUF1330 family)